MQVINKALVEGFLNTAQVVSNLISAPLPLGYSSAGEVIETGRSADPFKVGDRVACAGLGQANHAEHVALPITMACKLPENVSTEEGAFGTLGAIALHGARLANPELGETFLVIGLGLLGQLSVQILKACGCRVLGLDIDPAKVELALANGLDAGGVIGRDDPKELVFAHTGGYGADGVLVAAHSKSNDPIVMAADLAREKGRVVAIGLINLDIPRRTFFEKELRLEVSRAYGAGAYDSDYERKGRDYPLAYVRWARAGILPPSSALLRKERLMSDHLSPTAFRWIRSKMPTPSPWATARKSMWASCSSMAILPCNRRGLLNCRHCRRRRLQTHLTSGSSAQADLPKPYYCLHLRRKPV